MVTVKENIDFGAASDLPCITLGDVEKDDYLKTLKIIFFYWNLKWQNSG